MSNFPPALSRRWRHVVGAKKMDSFWGRPSDLSVLAPPPEVNEALSSWLVRTAEAHLLTISELERELHGSIAELDRGNLALLPRLAIMMRTEVAALREMILPDFLRQACRAGPQPPSFWAVCPYCLERDIAQGRAAHVRRNWTHPLAVYCWMHSVADRHCRIRTVRKIFLF
jgi:hypothetical protein